jgi:hypothetical protein
MTGDITERALNRETLRRQLLLRRERLSVPEAVHRVVALQAQHAPAPYLALHNRIDGLRPADVDTAFSDATIVKASMVRLTLHAVTAQDRPDFHRAMVRSLRASRLGDPRFTVAGLSIPDMDELLPQALRHLRSPRTGADMESWLDEKLGVLPRPGVWWAMRTFAPVRHVPVEGQPWLFGPKARYVAAGPVPELAAEAEAAASPGLLLRYLQGFGPATIPDMAQFSILRRPVVKAALAALGDAVHSFPGPGKDALWDVADGAAPDADLPAPARLLPMWDSILLAYADRSRILPEPYRRVVIRQNGDVLPTVLVDGHVAGIWRMAGNGVEITAFEKLPRAAWSELAAEATLLRAFVADRDPDVFGRYGHWWKTIEGVQRRVLS